MTASSARADTPLAITVGDSLARDYPDYPCCNTVDIQGWGLELRKYFGPGLAWRNDAIGGQSSTSFLAEGHWANTLAANPRFILIMFGTNDFQDPSQYADPNTTYRQNLHQMITDAQGIGAELILVTPPPIRTPDYDGVGVLHPGYVEPWAQAMIAQGAADGVPVVAIYDSLLATYEQLGVARAQQIYGLQNPPGTTDPVHFSPFGADQVAQQIVAQAPADLAAFELESTPPPLQPVPALSRAASVALAAALGLVATMRALRLPAIERRGAREA